jgi:glycylpeptide N-tetradecanoyltransferase
MKTKDVPRVTELLNEYLRLWKTHIIFTEGEVEYYFMPRDNVIHSYVVEDSKTITDFFSFYSLPSSILKHETHKLLRVAYSYYNVSTTDRLKQGIEDMLVVARDLGYDVFNALDVMDNSSFLEQLKFGVGDGHLHYYHYNWRTGGELTARDMGIVLV